MSLYVHKFGRNSLVGGTAESVWSHGELYPWAAFNPTSLLYVKSASTLDLGTVEIQGLDADYLLQTETVTLQGQVAVATTNQFSRVFRMRYSNGPEGNAGDITAHVNSGVGTIVAQISEGASQTQMAVYTVPANYRAEGIQYTASTSAGDSMIVEFYVREFGSNFQLKSEIEVTGPFTQTFSRPIPIPPKADIDVRAYSTGASNKNIIFNFDLMLYNIDPFND